jgi:photosystem II oxygen-evolving enhancer protein 3
MAQAMASMTGLSQGVLPSRRAASRARTAVVRASADGETGRRAVLGLVATGIVGGVFTQAAHAEDVKTIKIGPPPPPSGGLRECLPCLHLNFFHTTNFFSLMLNLDHKFRIHV